MSKPIYTSLVSLHTSIPTTTPRTLFTTPGPLCKELWVVKGITVVTYDTIVDRWIFYVTWETVDTGTPPYPIDSAPHRVGFYREGKGLTLVPPGTALGGATWRGNLPLPPGAALGVKVTTGHISCAVWGWRLLEVTPMPAFPLPVGSDCSLP